MNLSLAIFRKIYKSLHARQAVWGCTMNEKCCSVLQMCHYCKVTLGSRTSHTRAGCETPASSQSPQRSWRSRGCQCTNASAADSSTSPSPGSTLYGTSMVYPPTRCIVPYNWPCLISPVQPKRESSSHTEKLQFMCQVKIDRSTYVPCNIIISCNFTHSIPFRIF